MSFKTRLPVFVAAMGIGCAALGADPLRMEVVPALGGFVPTFGTIPVAVNLHNDGANAHGVLRVMGSDGYQMDYPIELPRGSQKRLLTYPTVEYGGLRYLLTTDQGNVLKNFEPSNFGTQTSGGTTALLISDNSGDLSFLRTKGSESAMTSYPPRAEQSGVQDVYASPDLAPNRPVGYVNLAAVFLGSGAERLSDEQVHALKLYALAGGTLVFFGGASSPVLGDARWQEVLPARDFRVVNLENSAGLERLGNEAAPNVSVMSGTPVDGAVVRRDGSALLTADRGFGLGKVVYLAFNPLEPPLTKWEGRKGAVSRAVRLGDWLTRSQFFDQFTMSMPMGMSGMPPGSSPFSTRTGIAYAGPGVSMAYSAASAAGDPFSTKLPPTERVFTLLGAYFLVVVPLNFLVLKKLKRGELAWFTAPLISLGFAGAFFSSAQGLYSAKMSTAAQGALVGQAGMEEGLFVGSSQIFVPRSGTYDLKFQGVDSLAVTPSNHPYYGRSEQQTAEFDPVDVGEVLVPHMQANNLAFREIGYRQRFPVGKWFTLETKRTGPDSVHCVVRNLSDYTLVNPSVMLANMETNFPDLKPGESKELDITAGQPLPDEDQGTWSLKQVLGRYRGVALLGTLRGFRPGPQLGQQVDSRTSVRLIYFGKEALGPK